MILRWHNPTNGPEVRAGDRVAFECLYARQVAVMDGGR